MRLLFWTLVAIGVGIPLGFVIMLPVVGAPHAFPGLLLNAPDNVRNNVSLAIVVLTPVACVLFVWFGPLRHWFAGRTQ